MCFVGDAVTLWAVDEGEQETSRACTAVVIGVGESYMREDYTKMPEK